MLNFPYWSFIHIYFWLLGQEVRAALAAAGVRRAKFAAAQTGARVTPAVPKRTKAMVTKDSTLHLLMKKYLITMGLLVSNMANHFTQNVFPQIESNITWCMWWCKLFRILLRRLPLSLRSPRVAQAHRLTRVPLLVTKLSVIWIHSWLLQLRRNPRMGVHVDTIYVYTRNKYDGIRHVVMVDHYSWYTWTGHWRFASGGVGPDANLWRISL